MPFLLLEATSETSFWNGLSVWFAELSGDLHKTFIASERWKLLWNGLGATLQITLLALVVGLILGFLIAIIRVSHDKTGKLKFLNGLCKLYLTVIRGTPVVVQLMLMYFVVFASSNNKILSAVLAFGINSGAYVAEIVRAGIMSIETGQMEAGRSLGFNYIQTMWHIVLPQAIKNVLPALGNEFITLLKETSVAGYATIFDLTKAANTIIGVTYEAFLPLIAISLVYLGLVMLLSFGVGKLEQRLQVDSRVIRETASAANRGRGHKRG